MTRSASEVLKDSLAEVATARSRLKDKYRTRRSSADQVRLFNDALLKGQADAGVKPRLRIVGEREIAKLKRIINILNASDIDIEAFARFIGSHWHTLDAAYFSTAKSYPKSPATPGWIEKCLAEYVAAFEDRERLGDDFLERRGVRETTEAKKATNVVAMAAQKQLAEHRQKIRALEKQLAETERTAARAVKYGTVSKFEASETARKANNLPSYDDEDAYLPAKPKRKLRR